MRLGNRRAGTSTSFVDSELSEVLLTFSSDDQGNTRVAFCLYDADGALVNDSQGLQPFPDGLVVRDSAGQLLLDLPVEAEAPVQYRLFSRSGRLLTWSDGAHTQIFGFLRMEHGSIDKPKPLQSAKAPAS